MQKESGNRTSTSQEGHADQATRAAAASALQSLAGKIRSGCSEGFSSAFLWGRFEATASQCPKSHRRCGFHRDLKY